MFHDDFAVRFFDEEHSADEERFIPLGMSSNARLPVVCTASARVERSSASFLRERRLEAKRRSIEVAMKAEYDFSKMKARKNPYASNPKKPVTMRLSEDVVESFKAMAAEAGVPYQSLIHLYRRDCLAQNRRVEIRWPSTA